MGFRVTPRVQRILRVFRKWITKLIVAPKNKIRSIGVAAVKWLLIYLCDVRQKNCDWLSHLAKWNVVTLKRLDSKRKRILMHIWTACPCAYTHDRMCVCVRVGSGCMCMRAHAFAHTWLEAAAAATPQAIRQCFCLRSKREKSKKQVVFMNIFTQLHSRCIFLFGIFEQTKTEWLTTISIDTVTPWVRSI